MDREPLAASGSVKVDAGEVAGAVYREVPIKAIKPNPKQPRQVFDEEALDELEPSISEFGFMQPIVVRELPDKYELVMGERRCVRAGDRQEHIPAIVRDTATTRCSATPCWRTSTGSS